MKSIKKIVGNNLVRLRQNLKLTQEELAAKSGLSQPTIQRIEYGERFPRAENIEALANAMNVHVSDFFIGEDHPIMKQKKSAPVNAMADAAKFLGEEIQRLEDILAKIPEDILEKFAEEPPPDWNFVRAALGLREAPHTKSRKALPKTRSK